MTDIGLEPLGVSDVARRVAARELAPTEVITATLERIARLEPMLHAFLVVFDDAIDRAARIELRLERGQPVGPLAGVPISVKDLVLTTDAPTTAGSRTFGAGVTTTRDARVVERLRRAGAIIVGKTNLHEIAMGVTTINEHFGPSHNPWDLSRIAGGSSGGSAVAVAAELGCASVGTDTRGSIRIPAACCGITGLKPTRGLVSTDGVLPLSWTLDHVGPMTRSVRDAALMLAAMVGRRDLLARYLAAVDHRPTALRLGIADYYFRDIDPEIDEAIAESIGCLEAAGHTVRRVDVPELDGAQHASAIITGAEALAYHDERLRAAPDGFGPLVRQRLERGYALGAIDFVRAQRTRLDVAAGFERLFAEIDCLVAPTLAALPHRIGEESVRIGEHDANPLESFTRLNSPQNMAGIPALSVPCGFSAAGLPIGLQLIAARGRDDLVLALGAEYQRLTTWHRRRPELG